MTRVVSGHKVVSSIDRCTFGGTSEREMTLKPSLEKNRDSVSVSRYKFITPCRFAKSNAALTRRCPIPRSRNDGSTATDLSNAHSWYISKAEVPTICLSFRATRIVGKWSTSPSVGRAHLSSNAMIFDNSPVSAAPNKTSDE
jgi:hypothetical protein